MFRSTVIAAALIVATAIPASAEYRGTPPVYGPDGWILPEMGVDHSCNTLACWGSRAVAQAVADGDLQTPVRLNNRNDCERLNFARWPEIPCIARER